VKGVSSSTPIAARPILMDFGAVTLGQSADLPLTVWNNSASAVSGTIGLAWVAGLPCAEFQVVGSPSFSIPGGSTATLTLRFQPVTAAPTTARSPRAWGPR